MQIDLTLKVIFDRLERFSVGQIYGRKRNQQIPWAQFIQDWYNEEVMIPNDELIMSYESYQ